MKRITDPDFKYTPSAATDITKAFARERKRLLAEQLRKEAQVKESNVKDLRRAAVARKIA